MGRSGDNAGSTIEYRRALIAAALATALLWGLLSVPQSEAKPAVGAGARATVIVVVPRDTSVERLGRIDGMATGLLSAGLGRVPAGQTYLDISQGARAWSSLYGTDLPPLRIGLPLQAGQESGSGGAEAELQGFADLRRRADRAPGAIVPGLLASTLGDAGVPTVAATTGRAAVMAVDRGGRIRTAGADRCGASSCRAGVTVLTGSVRRAAALLEGRGADDTVIVLAAPPPPPRETLIAVAASGPGLPAGRLRSPSTRTAGLVTAPDIAATVLAAHDIELPEDVEGRPVTSVPGDAAQVAALRDRLVDVAPRRGPVVGQSILLWLALTLAAALGGRSVARRAVPVLATAIALVPAVLLLTAAWAPGLMAERLVVLIGTPVLAWALVAAAGPWRAFALASGLTVGTHLADLVAGTGLIPRGLLGPNPALGARFYGIGNELEATLGMLALLGTGAALAGWAPLARRTVVAACFAGVAAVCAVVLGAGGFGADVGAVILLGAGGTAAVLAALRVARSRAAVLMVLCPAAALAALIVADLLFGGDAHLTRSVLQAGGLDALAEVAERRLRLSARSFVRTGNLVFMAVALPVVVVAVRQRRRIGGWLGRWPAARAGFIGATAATIVGTLANDSGALLLLIGTGLLMCATAVAWAALPEPRTAEGPMKPGSNTGVESKAPRATGRRTPFRP
ncbi:MAG: hypothetical protein ACR2NA_11935 [Solirubrobacterales bacterium]